MSWHGGLLVLYRNRSGLGGKFLELVTSVVDDAVGAHQLQSFQRMQQLQRQSQGRRLHWLEYWVEPAYVGLGAVVCGSSLRASRARPYNETLPIFNKGVFRIGWAPHLSPTPRRTGSSAAGSSIQTVSWSAKTSPSACSTECRHLATAGTWRT